MNLLSIKYTKHDNLFFLLSILTEHKQGEGGDAGEYKAGLLIHN